MYTVIKNQETILGIIIKKEYKKDGISFFSPPEFSQQLGYMNRPKDYIIAPHDHNPVPRTIEWTQEVLIIKSGRIRLDLYLPESRKYLESYILETGDLVLLAHGGHGIKMLEESEILEVKQGPYAGEADKTRFTPVTDDQLSIRE